MKTLMSHKFREKAFEDIELWSVEWEHIEKAHDYLYHIANILLPSEVYYNNPEEVKSEQEDLF